MPEPVTFVSEGWPPGSEGVILLNRRFWASESGAGPEILHFWQVPK